jgi:hypothetical protein
MNLAKRAREAAELTSRGFAELIGVSRPQVSRWEKTGKWPAAAECLFHLIVASPAHSIQVLRVSRGLEVGFAGDAGPPPERQQYQDDGPTVDEYGNPTADGPGPEADLGFEPGAFDVDMSPEFGAEDELVGAEEDQVTVTEDQVVVAGADLELRVAADDVPVDNTPIGVTDLVDDLDQDPADPDEVPGFQPSF